MTGRVLPFDPSAHAAVDAILPWYVNSTLKGDELAAVEEHLRGCEQCRREVDWLRNVFSACSAMPSLNAETLADPAALAALERGFRQRTLSGRISEGWRGTQPWVRWLMAAQVAAIAVLGTLVAFDTRDDAAYRTLGATNRPLSTQDALAVVFDPAVTESEIERILKTAGARIVDGPTTTNAFVLEVPAARSNEAMKALRAERGVRLAERLGPGTTR